MFILMVFLDPLVRDKGQIPFYFNNRLYFKGKNIKIVLKHTVQIQ